MNEASNPEATARFARRFFAKIQPGSIKKQ
jgi:hypothetical protein